MTTQHNSREAFEKYRETVSKNLISLKRYDELHMHNINYPMQYQAWQASQEAQADTIAQLEEQLKDREGDLKFEYNERINQEGIALRASYKYVEYCDLAEEKIAQLQLDNARMREKMHMAKIQGSRADCNLILNQALATQPTEEYNPFINEGK